MQTRILKLLNLFLILIPFLILIYFVFTYKVDVPIIDQWSLPPLLEKSYRGTLSFADLWAQHNEHRIIFPKIIMIGLARLTGWNISFELALSILLAASMLIIIGYQANQTNQSIKISGINWIIPALSFLIFSLSQAENWLQGWQLQIFLNLLAVSGGFALLANSQLKWKPYFFAILLGLIATFSFANGILYWIIGLYIILMIKTESKSARRFFFLLWMLIGLIVIYLYFYGYQSPPCHPYAGMFFYYPIEYFKYVLSYLGSPISRNWAIGAGVAGIVLFTASLAFLRGSQISFYVALSLYSIGSALLTGIGRMGFRAEQALISRYVTISNLLWICNLIFLYFLIKKSSANKFKKYTLVCLFAVILSGVAFRSYNMIPNIQTFHNYYIPCEDEIKKGENWKLLSRLHPGELNQVKERLPILKKYHLSIFRTAPSCLK